MNNRENTQLAAQASVDAAKLSHAGARMTLKLLLEIHAMIKALASALSIFVVVASFPNSYGFLAVASAGIFAALSVTDIYKSLCIKI